MKLSVIAVTLVGLAACHAEMRASDIYIAQNATGANNGESCSNAYAYTFFNNSANWAGSGGKIGPGTTVHLCGTFTGSPGQQLLRAQGGGSAGNPITIHAETGAVFTAPYWGTVISIDNQSYIVVDGGSNGVIQNTANGTGLAYHAGSIAVSAVNTISCEVKNWTIQNLYVHKSLSDTSVDQTEVMAVHLYPPATNFTFDNNNVHDVGWALNGVVTNLSMYNNDIYNMDHGIALGNQASGTTRSGISIHNNHFHDYAAWDTSTDSYHHDGIHIWGNSNGNSGGPNNGIYSNIDIYDNLFDGNSGNNVTSHIFLEDSIQHANVYNNIMVQQPGGIMYTGILAFYGRAGDNGVEDNAAYDNTIVGQNIGTGGNTCLNALYNYNFSMKNNLIVGCNTLVGIAQSTAASNGINDNVYENVFADGGSNNTFEWANNYTPALSSWQSNCRCDANAVLSPSSQIKVNTSGSLQPGSVAIGAGANLTSLGLPSLDADEAGTARSSSGAWVAGALTLNASPSGAASAPAPPVSLAAVSH